MWHTYALMAQDRIRDRHREAAAESLARRAADARRARDDRLHRVRVRAAAPRQAVAAVLRRIESMAGSLAERAHGLAERAHGLAARVEGGAERRVA